MLKGVNVGSKSERLIIKSLGPLKYVDLEVKPFMVFVGESGSGKSLLMKTLAFCRHVFKEYVRAALSTEKTGKQQASSGRESGIYSFIRMYDLLDYFSNTSLLTYEDAGTRVEIWDVDKSKRTLKVSFSPEITSVDESYGAVAFQKNCFVSDDRFAIPLLLKGLQVGRLPYYLSRTYDDFLKSFDFLSESNDDDSYIGLDSLGFGLYRSRGEIDRFFVGPKGSKGYDIGFEHASSGVRSVSVLEPIVKYYTTSHRDVSSCGSPVNPDTSLSKLIALRDWASCEISKIAQCARTNLLIEEPELSLFPGQQKRLLNFLVAQFNGAKQEGKKEVNLMFSTHSPYLITHLNCLLKAASIVRGRPDLEARVGEVVHKSCWLDPRYVSAFKVEGGEIKSLRNADYEDDLIGADSIDSVSRGISSDFEKLLRLEFGI